MLLGSDNICRFFFQCMALDHDLNLQSLFVSFTQICNYPFTTRGILMGHIAINYKRFQVTDTPGLLKRCDGKPNYLWFSKKKTYFSCFIFQECFWYRIVLC